MKKCWLLCLLLLVMHVQAAPYEMQLDELQQRQVQLAMTDIVRVNSPSSDEASSKKWAQLTEQQRKVLALGG